MELKLTSEGAEAVVENARAFLAHDPSDETQYAEGLNRLLAIQFMFEDLLRHVDDNAGPMTAMALTLRTTNPYYTSILPNDGLKP
jgi:hypothetical protein